MRIAKFLLAAMVLLTNPIDSFASRQKHFLESIDIADLRVSSISPPGCGGRRFAYISDRQLRIHHIEVGEYIGRNEGLVVEILDREIIVVELVKKKDGYEEHRFSMPLQVRSKK